MGEKTEKIRKRSSHERDTGDDLERVRQHSNIREEILSI
jgi:hypothetical protein